MNSLVTDDPCVAAACLAEGGLAVLPTETVYGLAAAVTNRAALTRIFSAKGRPADHPLIAHFGEARPVSWAEDGWISPDAIRPALDDLAADLWPGPLTVIVPRGPAVPDLVTGGRDTVGVRVPDHSLTLAVLDELGVPVAAPSANRFGRVSPTTVDHVLADLASVLRPGVDIILDGGASACGVESTIVDLTSTPPQLLRPGALDRAVAATLGEVAPPTGPARASGMLSAHYAPTGFVSLAASFDEAQALAARFTAAGHSVEIVDRSADPLVAARHLYDDLRRADAVEVDGVVFVLPPAAGVGIAVRDRLQRAATGSAPPSQAR